MVTAMDCAAPELEQFMIHNVQRTGKSLGHGAFGDVDEIIMDGGTLCAGKVLHQAFLDPNNLGLKTVLNKFVLECQLLADIRHPNIVQFMGICFLGGSQYPALVMEKLDTSLDALLEKKEQLHLFVKFRILFDVSKGLVYLHHGRASPIIHRDLTTRNVLINKDSMNAKIADLGNARVIDKDVLSRSLTQAPGTTVYMPPEALGKKPDYTTSLDIFSFGHLSLFTINQIFPGGLLSPTYIDQHTYELHARSELDRRKEYMDLLYGQVGRNHAVSHMVEHCLSNRKERRPTARDVMEELRKLQQDASYLHETSRKSDLPEGRMLGSKHETRGILEIEHRSKFSFLNKKPVWKQYIFQADGTDFQYVKGSKVLETIHLNSITSVQTYSPVDGWFPFNVLFNGKGSPWNLRASSQEECNKWTGILRHSMQGVAMSMQPYEVPVASGMQPAGNIPLPFDKALSPEYEEIDDKFANAYPKKSSTGAVQELPVTSHSSPINVKQLPTAIKARIANPPQSVRDDTTSPSTSNVQPGAREVLPNEGRIGSEPPVSTNRNPSYSTLETGYTPMEAIQFQQPQELAATRNRASSTASSCDVPIGYLQLSLQELTKEQLLTYIHLQAPNLSQQEPSRYNLPCRSSPDLYVNANFHEIPPPLPPKPQLSWSSCNLRQGPIVPPRGKGVSKSQSVLLPGSSAEAIRQRFQYRGRKTGGSVTFQLSEEDEDDEDVFPPTEHIEGYTHNTPPGQQFQRQQMKRPRNIPQRSHTMKAYLPSTSYRQDYMDNGQGNGKHHLMNCRQHLIDRGNFEGIQPEWPPNIHEDVFINPKKISSDKYLNVSEGEEERDEEIPQWATCIQSLSSSNKTLTPDTDLASLQRLALFIDKEDLYEMHQIGKGQFGKVYRAKLSRGTMSIDVAVKTIKKYELEKERAEFLHEQAIMSQLAHPNVVRLYGLVQQESPWIVLEFLPNGDLKNFLIKNERPMKTLLKYMLDVALGMHYISEKGLVHRDIAARNIMVTHDETCKVGDFGLLRELPKGEEIYVSVSKSPAPIRWMAPESLHRREFSTASDVWSYGVLLWEMCQPARLPYEGMDNYQCGFSVIQGKILDIPLIFPPGVRKIMKACWHGTPAKRPSFLLILRILNHIIFSADFL